MAERQSQHDQPHQEDHSESDRQGKPVIATYFRYCIQSLIP